MSITLLTNARIWTGSRERPWAGGIAVEKGRIAAVGSSAEIMKLARGAERVIDARGSMVVPGFIDAHIHLVPSALRIAAVQLRDASSRDEMVERIRAFAATLPAGAWITGGDWDHYRWGGELPTRAWIDAAAPDHLVFVSRHDGHMALANSRALGIAAIDGRTPDPPGGVIVRDAEGEPTGVLKDEAMAIVLRHIPPPSTGDVVTAIERACRFLAERGVTSVHHMGTWEDVDVLRAARAAGVLRTRVYAAVPLESWERLRDTVFGEDGDEWLRLGGLKAFMDGSLGSHTAAFLEPYADAPDDRGILLMEPARLQELCGSAVGAGLQPIVHAIGDRAVRAVLDVFEAVASEERRSRQRPRIEHAQHVHPDDLPRFARLGVIASVQPYHLADDGRWAEGVIGAARMPQAYPIGSLARSGATVAFGSDWFVAPPEPLAAIDAAVTRRTLGGAHPEGWTPEERVGVEEALRAHTLQAALAEHAGSDKGTLERGKLADLVMIDRDLTKVDPGEIGAARILLTMVGGEVVHDAA